ncbi:ferredoxin [Actinomadura sp. LOL_016]|uniref:ferredoxin n=1 Tax=unclassified Actinomadura TaxID=2626254 RepID=UPI003A809553
MRIIFDRDLCAGHAQCAMTAPDVFPLDDAGYCDLKPVTDVPAGLEEQAREGVRRCPERAITIGID